MSDTTMVIIRGIPFIKFRETEYSASVPWNRDKVHIMLLANNLKEMAVTVDCFQKVAEDLPTFIRRTKLKAVWEAVKNRKNITKVRFAHFYELTEPERMVFAGDCAVLTYVVPAPEGNIYIKVMENSRTGEISNVRIERQGYESNSKPT